MFEKFPKTRPVLPEEYARIYKEMYKQNRDGVTPASGIAQKLEAWMHKNIAADLPKLKKDIVTLELGAGTLNQLPHEKGNEGDYDIVEPFHELFEKNPNMKRIRNVYDSVMDINGKDLYDRIISVAVLEHIWDLPLEIAKSCMLLKADGTLRAGIPNEGRFMWTLAWRVSTGAEFWLRNKLDYGVIMKYEHANKADEIEEVVRHFFKDVKVKVFGISKEFAIYRFLECKNPRKDVAEKYLKEMGQKKKS